MLHGQNFNEVIYDSIVNHIRKSMYQNSADCPIPCCIQLWHFSYPIQHFINRKYELDS